MPLAIFGIGNTALNLAVTIFVLVLVAVWLALIVFTLTDARRRISDPFLVGCATAASLFPFVGTIIYTILRPPEFLEDVRERETEIHESEIRLRHLEHNSCHKCGTPVESDFIRCPGCRTRLKQPCPECSRPVGLGWKVCPYCEKTLIAPRRPARGGKKPADKGRTPSRSASGKSESSDSSPRTGSSRSRSGRAERDPAAASTGDGESRSRRRTPKDPDETRTGEPPKKAAATKREPINRGR
ncbi:MAG: zinc ribbon domain-containing protein [Solirubrobacterales bacterium]|nr:zinc ribbon domain-containing protein [Solirubrobacterales bacterium]